MRDSFRAILAENKRLLRDISVLGEQLRTAHANVGQLQEANASLKRECARLAIERDDARRRWRETAVTQAQTHAKYYVLGTRQASLHRLLDDVLPIAAQKAMETAAKGDHERRCKFENCHVIWVLGANSVEQKLERFKDLMRDMGPRRPLSRRAQDALQDAAAQRNAHAHPARAALEFLLSCLRRGTGMNELCDVVEGLLDNADDLATSTASLDVLIDCLPARVASCIPISAEDAESANGTAHRVTDLGWIPPSLRSLDGERLLRLVDTAPDADLTSAASADRDQCAPSTDQLGDIPMVTMPDFEPQRPGRRAKSSDRWDRHPDGTWARLTLRS
ncbi:hypothetical protein A1Q1_02393 [Trichosporon asahii var. asahii CBS 2479]|uniref:Uncharacterized protein n=1 Tax=Trichosporon asahii var. asahii (strain ATCC 90039 / CBS 2479 / JCM 2466 / KCTC 7840 / NBRC 103889/ NCYC 2677 / UAMH 7654) TaxID=1186058 RepID=J5T123_TRIAS|nr:hypothetical protein A1Q1_02393 [Trichosporon asahii var. asahii CBS 2479]EJT48591.1 hypothetical protein A1Q1_02393 [Trichosporon asahii var. asahii CBS 2479]